MDGIYKCVCALEPCTGWKADPNPQISTQLVPIP